MIIKIIIVFSEFSSQLPHDGGAFYTTDTMESARPHYVESWAPILHAATLWLNARGFEMGDSNEKATTNLTNNNNHNNNNNNDEATTSKTNMNVERFHLLFGKYVMYKILKYLRVHIIFFILCNILFHYLHSYNYLQVYAWKLYAVLVLPNLRKI